MNQIRSIGQNNSRAAIFVVGTHLDDKRCSSEYTSKLLEEVRMRYPKRRFYGMQEVIGVSCKSGIGIKELKQLLVQVAVSSPVIVPVPWVKFSEHLVQRQQAQSYVSRIEFSKWARSFGITDFREVLVFLSEVGSILYFDDSANGLKDIVILDPQFLANVMANLISFRNSWVKDGVFEERNLPHAFKQYSADIQPHLLSLLRRFDVLLPLSASTAVQNERRYLVPSLLPTEEPKGIARCWDSLNVATDLTQRGRTYKFPFLPLGFVERLLVRLLVAPEVVPHSYWRNGAVVTLRDQLARVVYEPSIYEFHIAVRSPSASRKCELLTLMTEITEGLLTCYYPRLQETTSRWVDCTHCLASPNCITPYQFAYQQCINALMSGSAFVYCNGIRAPSRCVLIEQLAPDISLDFPTIDPTSLVVGECIGRGAFGEVYKGIYQEVEVAIKRVTIDDESSQDAQKFLDFRREAYTMRYVVRR